MPIGIISYPNLFQTKTTSTCLPRRGPRGGACQEPFYVGQLRKFDAERSAGSIACKEAGTRRWRSGAICFWGFQRNQDTWEWGEVFFFFWPPPQLDKWGVFLLRSETKKQALGLFRVVFRGIPGIHYSLSSWFTGFTITYSYMHLYQLPWYGPRGENPWEATFF